MFLGEASVIDGKQQIRVSLLGNAVNSISPPRLRAAPALTSKVKPITAPDEDPKKFWTYFMFFSTVRDGMEFVGHSGYW